MIEPATNSSPEASSRVQQLLDRAGVIVDRLGYPVKVGAVTGTAFMLTACGTPASTENSSDSNEVPVIQQRAGEVFQTVTAPLGEVKTRVEGFIADREEKGRAERVKQENDELIARTLAYQVSAPYNPAGVVRDDLLFYPEKHTFVEEQPGEGNYRTVVSFSKPEKEWSRGLMKHVSVDTNFHTKQFSNSTDDRDVFLVSSKEGVKRLEMERSKISLTEITLAADTYDLPTLAPITSRIDKDQRYKVLDSFLRDGSVDDLRSLNDDFRRTLQYGVLITRPDNSVWFPDSDLQGWNIIMERGGMRHIIRARISTLFSEPYVVINSAPVNSDHWKKSEEDSEVWAALKNGDLNGYVTKQLDDIHKQNEVRAGRGQKPLPGTEDWEKIARTSNFTPNAPLNPSFQDRLNQSDTAKQIMVDKARAAEESRQS